MVGSTRYRIEQNNDNINNPFFKMKKNKLWPLFIEKQEAFCDEWNRLLTHTKIQYKNRMKMHFYMAFRGKIIYDIHFVMQMNKQKEIRDSKGYTQKGTQLSVK